jgi:uncharacterized protein YjbI with pentapeptide repeats
LSKKCSYNRENIRGIEKGLEEKEIDDIILRYGFTLDCQRDAETKNGFCLLHDPDAWGKKPNDVLSKFNGELKQGETFFIGIHLPAIKLLGKSFEKLEMPLCKFHQRADFSVTKFHKGANFFLAEFHQRTDFVWAEFHEEADFSGAQFHQGADFANAFFGGIVRFNHAIFGIPHQSRISPSSGVNYDALTRFHGVRFMDPSGVVFDFNDLSLVSFVNTDITRVNFRNVTWSPQDGAIHDDEAFRMAHKGIKEYPFRIFKLLSSIRGSKAGRLMEQASCRLKRLADMKEGYENVKKEYEWLIENACAKAGLLDAVELEGIYLTLNVHRHFINQRSIKGLKGSVEIKIASVFNALKEKAPGRALAHCLTSVEQSMIQTLYRGDLEGLIEELEWLNIFLEDIKEASREVNYKLGYVIQRATYYIQLFTSKETALLKQLKEKLNKMVEPDESSLDRIKLHGDVMRSLTFARRQALFLDLHGTRPDTLGNVLAVYRRLRENYDYNMDYEASGKFFMKEMELKRFASRLGEGSIGDYVILTLYKWLANYGESYLNPLLAMILVVILFGIMEAMLSKGLGFNSPWESLLNALEESYRTFFQMREIRDTTGVQAVERTISPLLLGLFFWALMRRFERRFRH